MHSSCRDAKKQGSHKRPFEAGDARADSCALRGPGGGAIEGPSSAGTHLCRLCPWRLGVLQVEAQQVFIGIAWTLS